MLTFAPDNLTAFTIRVFQAAGAPAATAERVAHALVDSNLVGHDSHGVVRIPQYLRDIELGRVNPAATPTLIQETPAIAVVDGQWAFGPVSAQFALDQATSRAKRLGLGAAGLRNAWHVGRLGEYAERAAHEGLVTHILCNSVAARVVPFGGREGRFSTNPLAWGIPIPGRPPVVLDFATSVVAEGKVRIAHTSGKAIPEGWVITADGQPTTNPADLYNGGWLLPFGGYKGSGLALVVDLVGALMVGMGASAVPDTTIGNGMLVVAIDPAAFGTVETFNRDAARLVERVKDTPPAPGFEGVMLPGEPEANTRTQRLACGIPITEGTWATIVEAARTLGVEY